MPTLNFAGDTPPAMLEAYVTSKMLFHDDAEKEATSFVRTFLLLDGQLAASDHDAPFTLPAWMAKTLVVGPGAEQSEQDAVTARRAGYTAGHILITLRIGQSLGQPISLTRALRVLERAKLAEAERVFGIPMYTDRETVFSAWNRMKPVAHLWAANALLVERIGEGQKPDAQRRVGAVLSMAGSLLRWAMSARAYRDEPVLEPGDAWQLPPPFSNYPDWDPPAEAELPQWLVQAIRHYKSA